MTTRYVYLYGELAERYGAQHEVCVETITDALPIIECNHPGFIRQVRRRNFHVAVSHDDPTQPAELPLHHVFVPSSVGDWHLVPALEGGKNGFKTIFSIVVGGALLATGIGGAALLPSLGSVTGAGGGLLAGLGASTGVLGLSYGAVALIGASFFLGGINQLLTQTPKTDTSERKPTTFSFSGPTETEDEGGPLQIIVGEVICSGIRAASSVESSNSASISQYFGHGAGGVGGIFGDDRFSFLVSQ